MSYTESGLKLGQTGGSELSPKDPCRYIACTFMAFVSMTYLHGPFGYPKMATNPERHKILPPVLFLAHSRGPKSVQGLGFRGVGSRV